MHITRKRSLQRRPATLTGRTTATTTTHRTTAGATTTSKAKDPHHTHRSWSKISDPAEQISIFSSNAWEKGDVSKQEPI